ncbi:MAG: hypothetical protein QOF88_7249 [Mycobacterium sp.]|nr:hypothetical protein [Mycobacterium sp.]
MCEPGGWNTATPGSRWLCRKPMSPVRRRRSTSASSLPSSPVSPRSVICSCCVCLRQGKPRASRLPARVRKRFSKGHVRAFAELGGVPGRIRYDNLKAAVARVLEGRCREETERFIALRSHYGFSSFFCRPGLAGSHEKGGVEGEIGRFRRRHLVPVPEVNSLTELNDLIAAADWIDDARHLSGRQFDIGTEFASERTVLGRYRSTVSRPA